MELPVELVSHIIQYIHPLRRRICKEYMMDSKPHIDIMFKELREYIESFHYRYDRHTLKYLRYRFAKSDKFSQKSRPKDVVIQWFTKPSYPKPNSVYHSKYTNFLATPSSITHQCCAKTSSGQRCLKKTCSLFCHIHCDSNKTYWTL